MRSNPTGLNALGRETKNINPAGDQVSNFRLYQLAGVREITIGAVALTSVG